ncbi:MAG TPA: YmdB family metallophosphoesterase [Thermomicrobiales bacterium]|nr:YmdB family metallophosphoesterase [Thermomicrobiales bacterium]
MHVLFIGDLVGTASVPFALRSIERIRALRPVDVVIVNAENAAHDLTTDRFGTSPEIVAALLDGGVDVITGGNHTWDRADAAEVLAHPRVLRPINVPADLPGHGTVTFDVAGEPVTVVNLIMADAFTEATPLWAGWEEAERTGTVIVDLHGAMPVFKRAFAFAVNGSAAAVLGTHTHEPSLALDILPGGTAIVTEVGFTGPTGGAGGGNAEQAAAMIRGDWVAGTPAPLATGPMTFAAVLVTTDGNRATTIERIAG